MPRGQKRGGLLNVEPIALVGGKQESLLHLLLALIGGQELMMGVWGRVSECVRALQHVTYRTSWLKQVWLRGSELILASGSPVSVKRGSKPSNGTRLVPGGDSSVA